MNIKKLFDNLLFYLSVPKCVCCRTPLEISDRTLCKDCLLEYENIKGSDCSLCAKVLSGCSCSNDYLEKHMVKRVVKVFRYRQLSDANKRIPSNELIYNIKRGKRTDLLDFISDEIIAAIRNSIDYKDYIITNVPRKRDRVIKYGLDHSAEIAKCISKKLGIEYIDVLKSVSRKPQKKTYGEERLKNAQFDYKKTVDLKGKRIIIVDDIITTGASMGHCAMLLRGLKAKEVVGACLAIAYKDKYTPFKKDFLPY